MPRRPLTRVFGETSIELKCLILFGAFLLLVISASFLSYWVVTENVVEGQNPDTGRLLAQQSMVAMHWLAFESKEKSNERFLAVVRILTRGVTDKEVVPGTARNPKETKDKEYLVRFILPDETQPAWRQPKDAREQELLKQFLKAKPEQPGSDDRWEYDHRTDSETGNYLYYQPVWFKKDCGGVCHAPEPGGPGFDLGDRSASMAGADAPAGPRWPKGT
jgi:hypothetical protein